VLSESCQYTQLSVISAISPAGDIYYQLQKTSYTSSEVLHFLQDLLLYFQQPLLILWEGASIHQSKEIKKWLRTHNFDGRVQLARLPAYRPQLNAAEPVWAWLKGGQLKMFVAKPLRSSLKSSRRLLRNSRRTRQSFRNFSNIQRSPIINN
jgi:transposase